MNELLEALYDSFYTPLKSTALHQEIENCHRALIKVLGKTERRLVLQIIDCKDQIAEDMSIDSFIRGFQLAWQLSNELNDYEKRAPHLSRQSDGCGCSFHIPENEE